MWGKSDQIWTNSDIPISPLDADKRQEQDIVNGADPVTADNIMGVTIL